MAGPSGRALRLKNCSMVLGSGTWYGRPRLDSGGDGEHVEAPGHDPTLTGFSLGGRKQTHLGSASGTRCAAASWPLCWRGRLSSPADGTGRERYRIYIILESYYRVWHHVPHAGASLDPLHPPLHPGEDPAVRRKRRCEVTFNLQQLGGPLTSRSYLEFLHLLFDGGSDSVQRLFLILVFIVQTGIEQVRISQRKAAVVQNPGENLFLKNRVKESFFPSQR